jgi:hypothetical protein
MMAQYYAVRLANRGLVGCRPTFQSTSNNSSVLAITTRDTAGAYYLLVTNASNKAVTVDANLSALLTTSSSRTVWEFSAANHDVVVGNPPMSAGHVTLNLPATSAQLLKVVP